MTSPALITPLSSKSPLYRKQWQVDRARGIDRTTDAEPVREHVLGLLRMGLTKRSVAEVARCSPSVLGRLLAGQQTMQVRTARRLLAVSVERVTARQSDHGHVPAVGSRRRLQALLVMGWRHSDITERIRAHGADTQSQLVLHQAGDLVERRTADAVRAAYADLWAKPGPSAKTRTIAAQRGYAPPLAWDDDTIDDPAARPLGVEGGMRRHREQLLEDVTDLIADGATVESACARLGVQRRNLERSLQRAGRHDLWRRLTGSDPLARQEAS